MPLSRNARQAAVARTRAQWNERAEWWDRMAEANTQAEDRPADIERTATALKLRPGSRVLDAGCGSGQWSVAFAELGCSVVGLDLSPEMLRRAEQHAREHSVRVEFRQGDLSDLPDPDAAFDAVHARMSLQFVSDLPAALNEIRRVLKPGGRLYASVPGALSPIYANRWRRLLDPGDTTSNWAVPWELEQLLRELGWTIVDGWGEYGRSGDGTANALADLVDVLRREGGPLSVRLQQAAATTWTFIAE